MFKWFIISALFCISLTSQIHAQEFSEISMIAGSSRILSTDKSSIGYSLSVSQCFVIDKVAYLGIGGGVSFLARSEAKTMASPWIGTKEPEMNFYVFHLPLGLGFIVGKQAKFTIGANVLPSYYLNGDDRRIAFGISPHLSYTLKANSKLRVGFQAKVLFLQTPYSKETGLQTTLLGGGIVLHSL